MTDIIFYEKPGCASNAKQKALLEAAGHRLEVRSLLSWPWDEAALLAFLAPLPVAEWFNRAAPRVKSGEVMPYTLSQEQALALLLSEPLLIRRPLMAVGEARMVGFDSARVDAWVGLRENAPRANLEGCSSNQNQRPVSSNS